MTPGKRSLIERLFLSEISPEPVCLFRIIFGLLVFVNTAIMAPDLLTFFGDRSIISLQSAQMWSRPSFSLFYLFEHQDSAAVCLFAVLLAASVFVTIGLCTRISTIVLFICLVSFHNRLPCIFNGADMLLRLQAFLLIFAPAGAKYSVDGFLEAARGKAIERKYPRWPLLLLQLQMAAVYCQTSLAKLTCPEWLNGDAVYYALRLNEYARFSVPVDLGHTWIFHALTWGALLIECALWTLIWVPRCRYYVLAAGVILHAGIALFMAIGSFSYVMIGSYVLYLKPETLRSSVACLTDLIARQSRKLATWRSTNLGVSR